MILPEYFDKLTCYQNEINTNVIQVLVIPVHVLLSDCNWYPMLQEHSYEPGVFLHFWEHLSVFSAHSSISRINVNDLIVTSERIL